MDNKINHLMDWEVQQKGFLVIAFLPYLVLALGYLLAGLVLSGYIAALAIVASIYGWRHNREIRYLIMAFMVSALPLFLVLLLLSLLFISGARL